MIPIFMVCVEFIRSRGGKGTLGALALGRCHAQPSCLHARWPRLPVLAPSSDAPVPSFDTSAAPEVLNQRLLSFFKLTGQHIGLNGIMKFPTHVIPICSFLFAWDLRRSLGFHPQNLMTLDHCHCYRH